MGNGSSVEPAKVVYIEIMGQQEKIVFSRKCNPRDIDFLLRQAAGIPNKFTKLTIKDRSGSIVPLSSDMPINSPSNSYRVQIKDAELDSLIDEDTADMADRGSIDTTITHVIDQFNRAFRVEELQSDLYSRLKALEKKFEREELKFLDIDKCKRDIHDLKDLIYCHRSKSPRSTYHTISPLSDDSKFSLKREVPSYPKYTLSKETTDYLKQPTFNMWHWEPNEMLSLLEHMYHELRLVKEFNINPITLKRWLLCVQENYRNNPFHNFRHCFCVTQMMYGFIHLCHLSDYLSTEDLGLLLTSCICHDLDHPGYNNTYQINAKTELAARYNNISPLEHHHCAVAFQILSNQETNLFANVDQNRQKRILHQIRTLILATDMAKHGEFMEQFNGYLQQFDFKNGQHVSMLKIILVKSCDISNELRPLEVSEPWLDCLLEEYFNQSDREKEMGLPVSPFMDREKVTKPSAQIGFIKIVLLPMFEAIAKLFPQLTEVMVKPLIDAHDRYESLKRLIEQPK